MRSGGKRKVEHKNNVGNDEKEQQGKDGNGENDEERWELLTDRGRMKMVECGENREMEHKRKEKIDRVRGGEW